MNNIEHIVNAQRAYFMTGETIPVNHRIAALRRLQAAVLSHKQDLLDAMHTDLGKSNSEAYMCEVGLVLSDIAYQLKHVSRWARPTLKWSPLTNFPAISRVHHDPYGVVLVMSPWNYPCLLTLEPVSGAIAAGNTVVVKPSAYSPATSAVIATIISEAFDPQYVACITGGRAENQSLLEQHFDYIFFTGGVTVGKMVMEKASCYLTPVTLELGGKSPVIIDRTANLRLSARRLVFGKWLNCGQTCIAPDYVLCHRDVHDQFVALVREEAEKMYGHSPLENKDYGKMINKKHFDRVCGLIDPAKVVWGGQTDIASLRIAPTILDGVTPEDAVMQEEIFGPVLPILTVETTDEAFRFIANRPHPLALYLFTRDRRIERQFTSGLQYGGGCVNDTIMHIATDNLPFGGVGNSGMGQYHGKYSFRTFTHDKSIVHRLAWPDIPLRYQPYGKLKDMLIRMFLH